MTEFTELLVEARGFLAKHAYALVVCIGSYAVLFAMREFCYFAAKGKAPKLPDCPGARTFEEKRRPWFVKSEMFVLAPIAYAFFQGQTVLASRSLVSAREQSVEIVVIIAACFALILAWVATLYKVQLAIEERSAYLRAVKVEVPEPWPTGVWRFARHLCLSLTVLSAVVVVTQEVMLAVTGVA